jgi:cytidylate kinase
MSRRNEAPVIALDGPAGAGKSTVAREVARRLGLSFLDTGAIYRAITLMMIKENIPPSDSPELRAALGQFSVTLDGTRVFVAGEDVTEAIRTPEIDANVSAYSALPFVRESILGIQRGARGRGIVAEGRDMGTVVFPDADAKIFLTASPEKRARRRHDERLAKGERPDYAEILRQVVERDRFDSTREAAPLVRAKDAILLDTTEMSFEDVVSEILRRVSNVCVNA